MSGGARAAVFRGDARIDVDSIPMPVPAAREVRVRLEGCGVCASNLPVWEGRSWFRYPLEPGAPGHEGWGTVDEVGREVEGVQLGDRVAFLSSNAYATHDVASADSVLKLPSELAGREFPGEPLGCVMNIFRRAGIESGHTVAIVGVGFLGAALAMLARAAGANVIAMSRRRYALEVGERSGAGYAVSLEDASHAVAEVMRITRGAGCERVIEAVGSQEALDVATALTGVRGRLVIAGYHQDGPRRVDLQQWNWRGIDVVNAHERDPAVYLAGMREALREVVSGRFDPTPLFTHRFALHEIGPAFRALAQRPDGFLKALVGCE